MGGTDEALSLSLPRGWSQLPPEILGIIFSNLLRKSDLLNSRLVCRSWNEECVRVMKKPESEFHKVLTESNINQYIDSLHNGDGLAEVNLNNLPFHLNINLNIVNSEDTGRQCYKTKLNKLTVNVKSLCENFGKECIAKFTLKSPNAANFPSETEFTRFWILDFLVIISPGLKILDLRDFNMHLGRYTAEEIKSTELCDLKFPKLMTMTFSRWKFFTRELLRAVSSNGIRNTIYSYIMDRSPDMENLEWINGQELIGLSVNYDKLRTLLVDRVIREPSLILQKFLQSNSPRLQKFEISLENYSTPNNKIVMLHNILEHVSSTLKSLTVTMVVQPSGYARNATRILMSFPRLPHLQHLKINKDMNTRTEDLIFCDPEEINFNPQNLSSLKSVELPLGFIFCGQSDKESSLKTDFEVPVIFSTVKKLTIRVSHARWSKWMPENGVHKGEGALKHLQKVFPNVSKLSIVNWFIEVEEQQVVKILLQSIIQSSTLSANIHEICIEEFDEEFLSQVLAGMNSIPCNSIFLTNVRIIRLRLSKISQINYPSDDPFPHLRLTVPRLTAMVKCFPSLQIIEMSEHLFRGMTETEWKDLIQTLTTTFPYLQVHRYK